MSLSYFDNVYIFTFNNCNKKTRILFASLLSKVVSAHVSVSYIKKKIFFTFNNCNKKARILLASLLTKVVYAHVSVSVCIYTDIPIGRAGVCKTLVYLFPLILGIVGFQMRKSIKVENV